MEVIMIAKSCTGSSDYFSLLAPYNGKSKFKVMDSFVDLMKTHNVT